MNLNLIARLAKLVALLGFLLPWVIVSCSGTEIATATGVQLMTGDIQPVGPMESASPEETQADPSIAVIASFAIIALGLLISLFLRGRAAAIALLCGAVFGFGATYFSVNDLKTSLREEVIRQSSRGADDLGGLIGGDQQSQLSAAAANAVQVQEQQGYWATLAALALAALFALPALIGLRVSIDTKPPPA